ncbi:MAG: hypothetical protein P8014_20380 [Acidihalobacter sp.]|uniref:hypothetical protein n=1 Tax=Acidihalobacter sp. TaxID=1872108 RepID=UPI00307D9608
MEFDQLLGDFGTPLQTTIFAFQLLHPTITWIGPLAPGRLRLQAIQTALGVLFTPAGKLGRIEAVAAQPGTLLTMRQRISLGQQAEFLGRTEAATCTLFKPWIGRDLGARGQLRGHSKAPTGPPISYGSSQISVGAIERFPVAAAGSWR